MFSKWLNIEKVIVSTGHTGRVHSPGHSFMRAITIGTLYQFSLFSLHLLVLQQIFFLSLISFSTYPVPLRFED